MHTYEYCWLQTEKNPNWTRANVEHTCAHTIIINFEQLKYRIENLIMAKCDAGEKIQKNSMQV